MGLSLIHICVDADVADKVTEENLDSAVAFAKKFAAQTGAVIAITGAIDIVADAQKAYVIRNGNAMMSSCLLYTSCKKPRADTCVGMVMMSRMMAKAAFLNRKL